MAKKLKTYKTIKGLKMKEVIDRTKNKDAFDFMEIFKFDPTLKIMEGRIWKEQQKIKERKQKEIENGKII